MQNARITLHPSQQRMQVRLGGILLADSTNTLELREHGYPPRYYFPREDVQTDSLTLSEIKVYYPFKLLIKSQCLIHSAIVDLYHRDNL